ncbi:MAG: cytochrome-c oxidase, cbb3-type subunit II [Betaproteobacteria bacterium]|nr:cytochrome-c oxidase, cbb3-type subunit II [Betaproteobacteria bacterium]MCL2162009.1 cytochrome-c oxidase, cbb3-type subunit II [Betaproteobacteria bacterium]
MAQSKHDAIESNVFLLIVLTLLAVSVGGLVEIVPLFFQKSTTQAIDHEGKAIDVKPYGALALAGRYVYIREGCYNCHSQMIRPFRAETERYGHFSVAGEFIYDHPFQWGSKRTGPDLARIGGRRDDEWHRKHLLNPRDVVPESNMPAFPWLDRQLSVDIGAHMEALNLVINPGSEKPYSNDVIANASQEISGKTELDALIAYLQGLGSAFSNVK